MTATGERVPAENKAAYGLLYEIEVVLRELLIEVLADVCGPLWWKQRLPSDVLQKFRNGRDYERNTAWIHTVPHHPIYYVDFPDLRKVIERSDNWTDVFKPIFGDAVVLSGTLRELEPIRNKVAHNRKVTIGDVRVVEASCHKISALIGQERFLVLVARCSLAPDILEHLAELREEAQRACEICTCCGQLRELRTWKQVRSSWWFDSDYLGHDVDALGEYFRCLTAYAELPRSRGSGHRIEAWLRANDIEGKYAQATGQLDMLLRDSRR